MTTKIDYLDSGFYFWLGADGELEPCTKEEFAKKMEDIRKDREDWLNVNVDEQQEQEVGG